MATIQLHTCSNIVLIGFPLLACLLFCLLKHNLKLIMCSRNPSCLSELLALSIVLAVAEVELVAATVHAVVVIIVVVFVVVLGSKMKRTK